MMESTILDGYSKEKAAFYLSPVTHLITIFLRARRAVRECQISHQKHRLLETLPNQNAERY